MNKLFTLALLAGVVSLAACKKESSKQNPEPITPVDKVAPDGFNYKTSKTVNLDIALRTNGDKPIAGVVVSVYNPANPTSAIYKAVTDKSGNIKSKISVPSYLTKLIIDPAYVGLIRNATANINGSATNVVIGGKKGFAGDVVPVSYVNSGFRSNALTTFANDITFVYPSPYKSAEDAIVNDGTYSFELGRPKFLEKEGDEIEASLLENVNASLPESIKLTESHPEYLASEVPSDLRITEESDVWITYVSEGAGFRNSLAYFTYETGKAPKRAKDIKNATFVFPNSSNVGSAGGLNAGDKVKLGRFKPGVSIGFILLQNAWNGKEVDLNGTLYFSQANLNPESKANQKKHSVVLFDAKHELFLIGFEDLPRDGDSDEDFNDLVFYATSNPVTGISHEDVPPVDEGGDKNDEDGDGVADEKDAFPKDPTRAYISYFPSEKEYAQVMFEDNWPNKGDYDLNDLVVNYQYKFIKNAKNEVVDLIGNFTGIAAGASFKNGFGVQLPIAADVVKSVSGQLSSKYISFASNGVESGQKKAVIIPFDNHDAVLKYPDGAFFVNTYMDKNKVAGTTVTVQLAFTSPVAESSLLPSDFNPFLISNQRRGYEVHLPGYAPTEKADKALFKTGDDTSAPGENRYYLTKENLPWAIGYNNAILYPVETVNINKAYLHFAEWALSGGASYADWYSNTASGYRVEKNLYTK